MTSSTLVLAGISFVLTVIWGSPLIRLLNWFKVGDSVRLELKDITSKQSEKIGTPTMGGVMFIAPVLLITLMVNAVALLGFTELGLSILLPLGTMLVFALLGIIDDLEKLRNIGAGEGMKARTKFLIQLIITAAIAFTLFYFLDVPHLILPVMGTHINLGWFYIPIAMFIITATSNAINFTDGLDGLAGIISATAFGAVGGIALMQEQIFLAQFCFIVVGAIFGFLWYNAHPAQLIMGDTGSMALGGTLGVVVLMTGHWILLPLIAIVPLSEVLSVIIQVTYFKYTGGKRFFKMTPIHHHFQVVGWSETQIVQRFWLIALLFAMMGLALAVL
jgi:phospho-N-acetylmuramoyl-pentapeptide-transferase